MIFLCSRALLLTAAPNFFGVEHGIARVVLDVELRDEPAESAQTDAVDGDGGFEFARKEFRGLADGEVLYRPDIQQQGGCNRQSDYRDDYPRQHFSQYFYTFAHSCFTPH